MNKLFAASALCHTRIVLSEGFYYGTVCDNLPLSYLLRKNAIFDMLQTAHPIYLSHQTKYLEQISLSGVVHKSNGCLAKVLYTTPLYGSHGEVHDNFFTLVLSHQSKIESSPTRELIVTVPNTLDGVLYGMNYLRAGILLAFTAADTNLIDLQDRERIRTSAEQVIQSRDFQILIGSKDDESAYQSLCKLAKTIPFFAHLYYESLTRVIMLSSQDALTKMLAKKGELNARNFYDLLSFYRMPGGDRYDTSYFAPTFDEITSILYLMCERGQIRVSVEDTLSTVLRDIREFIQSLGNLNNLTTHLEGQLYFTLLPSASSGRLMTAFTANIDSYRQELGMRIVINTATLKQEIGVVSQEVSFSVRGSDGSIVRRPYTIESEA